MHYLGIDYGTTKIGLATADSELKMAIPQSVIFYHKQIEAFELLKKFVKERGIDRIVVGLPVFLNQETEISKKVQCFGKELSDYLNTPVDFENEFLSSQEAISSQEAVLNRVRNGKKIKFNPKNLDSQAAAVILDSYLKRN